MGKVAAKPQTTGGAARVGGVPMKALRRLAPMIVVGAVLLVSASSASAGGTSGGFGHATCKSGNVASGHYQSLRITGFCTIPDNRTVTISGNLVLADHAILDSIHMGTVHIGQDLLVGKRRRARLRLCAVGRLQRHLGRRHRRQPEDQRRGRRDHARQHDQAQHQHPGRRRQHGLLVDRPVRRSLLLHAGGQLDRRQRLDLGCAQLLDGIHPQPRRRQRPPLGQPLRRPGCDGDRDQPHPRRPDVLQQQPARAGR